MRKVHRWLGLLTGIQLLAWTISGLYFTLIPIEEIRGSHLLLEGAETPKLASAALLSPSDVASMHPALESATVSDLNLQMTGEVPTYVIGETRVDARNGTILPVLSSKIAESLVRTRTGREVQTADWVTAVAPGDEYRGGELPAWRVRISGDEDAAVYVGASTGRLRAVRTSAWRWFDLLWALHIMDYEEREDFNHWLVQLLSVLGLITVASGLALFFMTQRWFPR